MWYPVSDLPFLPAWLQSTRILCICMSDVRLAFIYFFFNTEDDSFSHTHTHTLCWKTKATLGIRLLCSSPEGQKATDKSSVSIVVGLECP